jgi:hypothetical protein
VEELKKSAVEGREKFGSFLKHCVQLLGND